MTSRSILEIRSLIREGVPPENPLELFLTECITTNILEHCQDDQAVRIVKSNRQTVTCKLKIKKGKQ